MQTCQTFATELITNIVVDRVMWYPLTVSSTDRMVDSPGRLLLYIGDEILTSHIVLRMEFS